MSLAFNSSRIFFKYYTFFFFNRSGTVYCMLCVQMVSVCVSGGVTKVTFGQAHAAPTPQSRTVRPQADLGPDIKLFLVSVHRIHPV